VVALAALDFTGGTSADSIFDRSGRFVARHLHSFLMDEKMQRMIFLFKIAFSLFLFLGFSAGASGRSHEKKVGDSVAATEKFRLKIGEEKTLKSGVRVKIADTEFESKQINLPGVSAPASSRFTIILEVSFNGLSDNLVSRS